MKFKPSLEWNLWLKKPQKTTPIIATLSETQEGKSTPRLPASSLPFEDEAQLYSSEWLFTYCW